MTAHRRRNSERGIALITTLLLTLAIAAVAAGVVVMTSNTSLINRYHVRQSLLEAAADAGLEEGRSEVNGTKALYPDSGYNALETNAVVYDAAGNPVPNLRRSLYVGPTGITSGQYGVFGSVVADVRDPFGNRLVRRLEIAQESFAKYAYFTDVEPANIAFGGGDQIYGPVHTNDVLKIYSSGATFNGPVSTAKTINGRNYGTFKQGYDENAAYIAMPQMADLLKLQNQAAAGGMVINGDAAGTAGQATTRIEFVAIDLNGDGQVNGADEGFIRVYRSNDPAWVVGDLPADFAKNGLRNSLLCGHYHGGTQFVNAASHPASGPDSWTAALSSISKRCLLGGADDLSGAFNPGDAKGNWLAWNGPVSPLLLGRPDANYLWPITRLLNPSFKGVIFVNGNVAISGVVRSRVTVAATGNIVIPDDITYATNPGAGSCNDILGLFTGNDVVVADNAINSPVQPGSANNWFTYDDTKDEFIDAVILALDQFTVQNFDQGATAAEKCETKNWGRGCLYLTGGIIQKTRGPVGVTDGHGYVKRYSYDACAYSDPPPYFPTTGHFNRGHYYAVNPASFDISSYFAQLAPH
jgi:hypothetical protein